MSLFLRLFLLLAVLAAGLMPAQSEAARISLGGSQDMGCRIAIDGPIEAGDAQVLRDLLDQIGYPTEYSPIGRRICLNSPGGLLVEGLAMADLIAERNYGTAVPAGAACESACAVVFLAGRFNNPEAGGAFVIDRVMHPSARVGVHAPSLALGDRAYSREEVDKAYAIALDSMAGILRHRATMRTAVPDSLFLSLLGTPPFEMVYVDTVGQAAQWQIGVVPVAFPDRDVGQALTHACWNVDSGLQDYPLSDYHGTPLDFSFQELTADSLTAFSARAFRYEGSAQCEVRLFGSGAFGDGNPALSLGGLRYTGGATDRDVSGALYAYMLYSPDRKLDTLPLARVGQTEHVSLFFQAARRPGASGGGSPICRLPQGTGRVINVNQFVNLRAEPGLRAAIVGQLRLAETVRIPDPGFLRPVRNNPRGNTCLTICDALDRSPSDAGLKRDAQRCIADNMLWYQVISSTGETGFVSRHFLSE